MGRCWWLNFEDQCAGDVFRVSALLLEARNSSAFDRVSGQGSCPSSLLAVVFQGNGRCVKKLAAEAVCFAKLLVE